MSTTPARSLVQGFVTIVSGLPRSGTSMMMRMLEAGGIPAVTDNVRRADEDNPLGYYEYEPVKRTTEDSSWVEHARGRAVKMVYRLLYSLPTTERYRVIFMRRDLNEVLASQRVMLERSGKVDAVSDEHMSQIFRRELQAFDEWVKGQHHITLLSISYNDLLKRPIPVLEDVNAFLEGRLDIGTMAQVIDPSLYRNRSR